jgi:L-alanine-DL-glutamate epimerase-like enolase superfamily enzyme
MILEWAHYRDEVYNALTTAPDYNNGFLRVPDTPGIGIEVHEEVVKDLLVPGYAAL